MPYLANCAEVKIDPSNRVNDDVQVHQQRGSTVEVSFSKRTGWSITVPGDITDEEAMALTFEANPQTVTVGDYVEVYDDSGIRIGRIDSAHFICHGRVECSIDLM